MVKYMNIGLNLLITNILRTINYNDKILFLTEFVKVTTPSPPAGLEPATYRLTAERSANWAKEEYVNIIHSIY